MLINYLMDGCRLWLAKGSKDVLGVMLGEIDGYQTRKLSALQFDVGVDELQMTELAVLNAFR